MKKILNFIVIVSLLVVPMLSLGAEFRAGDNPSIGKDERIADDVYIAGGSVNSAGNLSGDFVSAGGNIVISGNVTGDVFVAGGSINIISNVNDDVRVGGGTIIINGKVGGDLVAGGGQVNISGSGISGDVVIGGGNVTINAPIGGDVLIGGGTVYINAPVQGNLKINAEKITIGKSAVISGNLSYTSSEELTKEEGAVINGKVDFQLRPKNVVPSEVFSAISSIFVLWKFLALLTCSLVVGLIMKRYSKEIVSLAVKRPLAELGKGVIAVIVMPIASVLLLITAVGVPFGIAGLLGFIITMIFTWIVTPIIIGSVAYGYLMKKESEVSWKTILLGVLIFILLGLIPVIGGIGQAVLILLTLGCVVSFKLKILKEWR